MSGSVPTLNLFGVGGLISPSWPLYSLESPRRYSSGTERSMVLRLWTNYGVQDFWDLGCRIWLFLS